MRLAYFYIKHTISLPLSSAKSHLLFGGSHRPGSRLGRHHQ